MDIREVANMLLQDSNNAILLAEKMGRIYPKNGDVYYIDTSGIIRVCKHNNIWILVDGHNMKSKVNGKTIEQLWNELEIE